MILRSSQLICLQFIVVNIKFDMLRLLFSCIYDDCLLLNEIAMYIVFFIIKGCLTQVSLADFFHGS